MGRRLCGRLRPMPASVVVAAHVRDRHTEGVAEKSEVAGFEVAATDDRVHLADLLTVDLMSEGRIDVVGDGEEADRLPVASFERAGIGPDDGEPACHPAV